MDKPLRLLLLLLCSFLTASESQAQQVPLPAENHRNKLREAPLAFARNLGQVADEHGRLRPDVLFTAHGGGAKIFIVPGGIHYQFEKTIFPAGNTMSERPVPGYAIPDALRTGGQRETFRFSLTLEGANPHPVVRTEQQTGFTENFYLGHCPSGITGVHSYGRLVMESVYSGIDWVIYSSGQGLKYDFIVHPGADPAQIKLYVRDADEVRITENGSLLMKTALGEVYEQAPVSFASGQPVTTSFEMETPGHLRFRLGAYDRANTLTIDPSITWATYYGGGSLEFSESCAVDDSGNVFMSGYSHSTSGIASASGFQLVHGGLTDAFLVKFDSSGKRQWATYYGGSGDDEGRVCTTDDSGNVYLGGTTTSTSGITSPGAHQASFGSGSSDAFLAKFSSAGLRQWATYYGGTAQDVGYACATDRSGNVYFSGYTQSVAGIASDSAHQPSHGGGFDGFLAKFDGAGVRQWGTYYGGSNFDFGFSCATDTSDNVYLAGVTYSSGMATAGAHQTSGGYSYLAKFDSSGKRKWGTYFGGNLDDVAQACATDKAGNIYITGYAHSSTRVATPGAHQATFGGGSADAFLAKFNASGVRQWGTYYGGTSFEEALSIATDGAGYVYIAGHTSSLTGIASSNALQASHGGADDAFLAKFTADGTRLWATYCGGSGWDRGFGCISDRWGAVYLAGHTDSDSMSSAGAFQNGYGGNVDAFLVKLFDAMVTGAVSSPVCAGAVVNVPFTAAAIFDPGNVYSAQLSDATGSFATAVNIGTQSGNAYNGIITATIPAGTVYGTAYRIRVTGSAPSITGPDNGVDITILAAPAPPVIGFTGDSLVSSIAGVQWYGPGGLIAGATGRAWRPIAPGSYYAEAIDSSGCRSAASNIISLTGEALSARPQLNVNEIRIYPNPAQGHVMIDLGSGREYRVSVYDPSGQKLIDNIMLSHARNRLDLSGYPAGLYFLTVRETGGSVKTSKIRLEP